MFIYIFFLVIKRNTIMSTENLIDLLHVLYQGSVRKHPLAVPPALPNRAKFFEFDSIPQVAKDYNLPLDIDNLEETLRVGLSRGIFQRSILAGTQCGANLCPTSSGIFASTAESLPVLIYAYNPSILKVNPTNAQILDRLCIVSGTSSTIKRNGNSCICEGTRGSTVTDKTFIPPAVNTAAQSTLCCSTRN
jgi:hypothetical protein